MSVIGINIAASLIKVSREHIHPCYEIIINIKGSGVTKIGDETYPFKKGTIEIIPPNTPHTKYSENGFKDIYLKPDKLNIDLKGKPLVIDDDENGSFENLFTLMLRTYLKREYNYHLVLDTLWDATEQLIISRINKNKTPNNTIELFMNDVIMNYTNCNFKISQAIERTNYCYDHFRRIFKNYTNMTPNEYLINLRIRCAKKLLTGNERKTIKEIAEESGFSDPLYFHKIFKKATGMSPAEYSKKL